MRVVTGKVQGGKVVVEGEPLEEGATVTVVASDHDETFELVEADERALLESIGQADRGETVTPEDLFRQLSKRT